MTFPKMVLCICVYEMSTPSNPPLELYCLSTPYSVGLTVYKSIPIKYFSLAGQ